VTARAGERGMAALELPLVIGLVLIPLGLLVLTIPTWIEHQHAATAAAGEAARAAVTAAGDPEAAARAVVEQVAAGHGLAPGALRLQLEHGARGGPVTARVTVRIPATRLPGLGDVGAVDWRATHTERRPDLSALP
jgi:hypothetical protein